MNRYSLTLLPDHVLLSELAALCSQDRNTTAALEALRAEAGARRTDPLAAADEREVQSPGVDMVPLPDGRLALQVSISQRTYEQLLYAHALMGLEHTPHNTATVLKLALKTLLKELG